MSQSRLLGGNRLTEVQFKLDNLSASAPSGGGTVITFSPPSGKFWLIHEVNRILLNDPTDSGATSGSHSVYFGGDGNSNRMPVGVTANYDTNIDLKQVTNLNSGSMIQPSSASEIRDVFPIPATNNHPFSVRYENDTDADINTDDYSFDGIRFTAMELDL